MDKQPLGNVRVEEVEAAIPELTKEEVQVASVNLARGGYVTILGASGIRCLRFTDVSERALRIAGIWPDQEQAGDQLLWFLERKVEEAATSDERTRWERIRDSFGSAGRDFAVEVAAAIAARSLGSG